MPREQNSVTSLRAAETPRKNSVGHADSVEKILAQISMLSPDPVTYTPTTPAGRTLQQRVYDGRVQEVLVTPSLFRTFICAAGCTACCQKFTLDYTPHEFHTYTIDPTGFAERRVLINGKQKTVYTNDQNANPLCDFLTAIKPSGGLGCAQWPAPPLSCISAPQLQFIQMRPQRTYVLKKPYGRAWAMTPTPKCEFIPFDGWEGVDVTGMVSILKRFQEWARYFGIKNCIQNVIRELQRLEREGLVPTQAVSVWRREG